MLRLWLGGLLAVALSAGTVAGPAIPAQADMVRESQMWVLDAMDAPAAWNVTRGAGVTVAVIDSGVDGRVSDLTGSVIDGPDLTGLATSPSNPGWGVHGTWMASLIAGHGHAGGGSGILGIAPRSKVLSIRVLADKKDPGYRKLEREAGARAQRALARAIDYATTHGALVISMSLGNDSASQPVRAALQRALDHGVVMVASSGNSGGSAAARRHGLAPYSFPADYPGVLGVGAVTQAGAPASFSSANLSVQIAAPGSNVPAQGREGQYWAVSGTSPACALTAGVAALIKARYPRLAPALVMQAITSSASNRPRHGYSDRVGFGTVDAAAALSAARRLSRFTPAGTGVSVGSHFGGGPAAVPSVPVSPRGHRSLVVYSLLAMCALVLSGWIASRLLRERRRARAHDGRGEPPGQGEDPWAAHVGQR